MFKLLIGMLFAGLIYIPAISHANVVSFQGTLDQPNDLVRFDFTLDSNSVVNLTTFGYAGGANGNSAILPDGGFDPYIGLYDAVTGNLISSNDDGSSVISASSGLSWDSFLSEALMAGDYVAFLGQFHTDFGPTLDGPILSSATGFNSRSALWALDIQSAGGISNASVNSVPGGVAAVPEPATYAMFLAGLGLMGFVARRKQA